MFGISFGTKSTKGTSDTTLNSTDTINGSQSTNTQGTQQQNSATQTAQQALTAQQQTTAQKNAQTSQGTGSTTQTGTSTTLAGDIQQTLGDHVKSILGSGVTDANIANLSNMIAGTTGFNADGFVKGIVDSARNKGEAALQESNSKNSSAIGGTAATNSMSALLANRGRNDLESSIAGITSQATATGQQIKDQNLQAGVAAQGSLSTSAAQLAEVLKGATTTTDQKSLTDQLQQLLGTQTGSGNTTGQTSQTGQSSTQSMDLISQLVNALTKQTDVKVGTENTFTTGKASGGGVSLGF